MPFVGAGLAGDDAPEEGNFLEGGGPVLRVGVEAVGFDEDEAGELRGREGVGEVVLDGVARGEGMSGGVPVVGGQFIGGEKVDVGVDY